MASNKAILEELGEFLKENYAPLGKVNSVFTLGTAAKRKFLAQKVNQFVNKARINLEWRRHLAERLNLSEDEVLRATNTIVEMIENALVNGGKVRLRNFGDFVPMDTKRGEETFRTFYFSNDKKWARLLNEPVLKSDLGLKRTIKGGKLTRRIDDTPAIPTPITGAHPKHPKKTSVQTEN